MKINPTNPRPLDPAGGRPAADVPPSVARRGGGSRPTTSALATEAAVRVDLSARSRELAAVLRVAAAAPDVRVERLAALRRELEAGTYRIDPVLVARAMLER